MMSQQNVELSRRFISAIAAAHATHGFIPVADLLDENCDPEVVRSSRAVEFDATHVSTYRDGKLVRNDVFVERDEAFRAAGLAE